MKFRDLFKLVHIIKPGNDESSSINRIDRIKLVIIRSLSYSGTTWINTALGCHNDVFALTSADRALDALNEKRILQYGEDNWENICNVHFRNCPMWPSFFKEYDKTGNFFLQLAKRVSKPIIVINNPVDAVCGNHFHHDLIDIYYVHWLRDLRAIGASYWRKNPQKSFIEVLDDFLVDASRWRPANSDEHHETVLKYEDAVLDPLSVLQAIGNLIGVDYDENALQFWNYDHHITGGNPSVYQLIRYAQGLEVGGWTDREYYLDKFKDIIKNPKGVLKDNRWEKDLSERELFLFDIFCGEDNAEFYYPRDEFSPLKLEVFKRELKDIATLGIIKNNHMIRVIENL